MRHAVSPRVQLNAGTKYWAVMSAPEGIGWLYSKQAATETVLESKDGGPWSTPPIATKTLALRIDAGFDACVPKAKTIPAPGETLGDMYVRTGHTAFNTISIENIGVAPLTWSGATFSGPDASVFSLFDQMSQAAPRFPRQIGVGGGLRIIEVRCTGGAQERWYRATLTFHTNDPTTPDQSFQVKCLVDNTPPNVTHHVPAPDGKNGWYVTQIPVTVNAIDPGGENASGVKETYCNRGGQEWWFYGGVQTVMATLEGSAGMGCSAVDLAGNAGSGNFGEFKLDTRRPSAVPVYEPVPTSYGWNNTATKLSFNCDDPMPGSSVELPATGGGTVTTETTGTDFTSGGCTDFAGWVSIPVTSTIRIDMTRPRITSAGLTPAPNAAGWNRSDVTVAWNCDDTGTVQSGIATDEVADVVVTQETASRRVTSSGTCADKAANSAAHIQQEVKLDKTAPTTTVDGPPAATNATSADLTFAGADALSGVKRLECKLDNGEYAACESPLQVSNLADGAHTLSVRAVDVADNVDATPATHTWTVDTVAPDTGMLTGPNGPTASKSAAFTYQGDTLGGTAIAGYECRIDDGAWGACVDYTGLAEGEHRFEVRAIDAAGNTDGSPATRDLDGRHDRARHRDRVRPRRPHEHALGVVHLQRRRPLRVQARRRRVGRLPRVPGSRGRRASLPGPRDRRRRQHRRLARDQDLDGRHDRARHDDRLRPRRAHELALRIVHLQRRRPRRVPAQRRRVGRVPRHVHGPGRPRASPRGPRRRRGRQRR